MLAIAPRASFAPARTLSTARWCRRAAAKAWRSASVREVHRSSASRPSCRQSSHARRSHEKAFSGRQLRSYTLAISLHDSNGRARSSRGRAATRAARSAPGTAVGLGGGFVRWASSRGGRPRAQAVRVAEPSCSGGRRGRSRRSPPPTGQATSRSRLVRRLACSFSASPARALDSAPTGRSPWDGLRRSSTGRRPCGARAQSRLAPRERETKSRMRCSAAVQRSCRSRSGRRLPRALSGSARRRRLAGPSTCVGPAKARSALSRGCRGASRARRAHCSAPCVAMPCSQTSPSARG